jgi:hypothetical protein
LDSESLVEGLTDGDRVEENSFSYLNRRKIPFAFPIIEGSESGPGIHVRKDCEEACFDAN